MMRTLEKSIVLFPITMILFCILTQFLFAEIDRSSEVNKYIEMLHSTTYKTRLDAAKYITRAGITDPKLYDVVRNQLVSRYKEKTSDMSHTDEMAWLCKALAASGMEQYKPAFNEVIENTTSPKLKKYARESLGMLAEHAEKNKIINDMSGADPSLSAEENRLVNMLRSDYFGLKRDAAKTIFRGQYKAKGLYQALNDVLLNQYKRVEFSDHLGIDTLAWMCKALGSSGMPEYKTTLQEIYESTSSVKLKSHVKKAMKQL